MKKCAEFLDVQTKNEQVHVINVVCCVQAEQRYKSKYKKVGVLPIQPSTQGLMSGDTTLGTTLPPTRIVKSNVSSVGPSSERTCQQVHVSPLIEPLTLESTQSDTSTEICDVTYPRPHPPTQIFYVAPTLLCSSRCFFIAGGKRHQEQNEGKRF